jgi:hypothetical protein
VGVRWELEHQELRIDPGDGVVAWSFKNVGDEAAPAGSEVCTVTIWKKPDGVPWTRSVDLPGADAVEPQSGVPLSATLAWDGQEPGDYGVRIDFNDNEAMAETTFHISQFGYVERFHNY